MIIGQLFVYLGGRKELVYNAWFKGLQEILNRAGFG